MFYSMPKTSFMTSRNTIPGETFYSKSKDKGFFSLKEKSMTENNQTRKSFAHSYQETYKRSQASSSDPVQTDQGLYSLLAGFSTKIN